MRERNAVIRGTVIEHDDHGVLTLSVELDYGGQQQVFGNYIVYSPGQADMCGWFVWRIMEVLQVYKWHHVVGLNCRVRQDSIKVHAVGHIIEDRWFIPAQEVIVRRAEADGR